MQGAHRWRAWTTLLSNSLETPGDRSSSGLRPGLGAGVGCGPGMGPAQTLLEAGSAPGERLAWSRAQGHPSQFFLGQKAGVKSIASDQQTVRVEILKI